MPGDGFGYDDVGAAQIGIITFWMRPIAALAAGILADRFSSLQHRDMGVWLHGNWSTTVGSRNFTTRYAVLGLISSIICISVGVYALRGIYFALVAESGVPVALTGTAIGIISTVGFLPDVFIGPIMGAIIDQNPGAEGHQQFFLLISAIAVAGVIASALLRRMIRKQALI